MPVSWKDHASSICTTLQDLFITDQIGAALDHFAGFEAWKILAQEARNQERTIFFAGNGASASMASHFAADVAKNAGIRTDVFTDIALITAVANDISYDQVYAEPLRWYMKKGDILIAISSSGNSPNVVEAVKAAQSLGGKIITLSAMSTDNAIRKLGDLNFYVPAKTYGMAETAHAAILHFWMDSIEMGE